MEQLRAGIANYELMKDKLKRVPHIRYFDMVVFGLWDSKPDITIKVTDDVLAKLHMTREEMINTAVANTARITTTFPLDDILNQEIRLSSISQETAEKLIASREKSPVQIIGNRMGVSCSAALFSDKYLKDLHKNFGEDYFLIPISPGAICVVKSSDVDDDLSKLEKTLQKMNWYIDSDEPKLSEHIFKHNGSHLSIAKDEQLELQDALLSGCLSHHRRM